LDRCEPWIDEGHDTGYDSWAVGARRVWGVVVGLAL
jgi:hypothetical protein